MSTFYSNPGDYGLKTIGEIEWSSGSYEFDLTVVFRRPDGTFVYGEDSGCSCPAPFENQGPTDLTVATVDEILAHMKARNANELDGKRDAEIATLLEAMLAAR